MVNLFDIMKNYTFNVNRVLLRLENIDSPLYVISDIHANLPALEAVLNAVPEDGTIICLGDFVNYYINPNEVCDLIRSRRAHCIVGNHDLYVLGKLKYNEERDKYYRVPWTKSCLRKDNIEWLNSLPEFLYLDILDRRAKIRSILAHHGNFKNTETYIHSDTNFDMNLLGENTLGLLGHTHHAMIKIKKNNILLNPGSVGQPRNGDPGASYAVIDLIKE